MHNVEKQNTGALPRTIIMAVALLPFVLMTLNFAELFLVTPVGRIDTNEPVFDRALKSGVWFFALWLPPMLLGLILKK